MKNEKTSSEIASIAGRGMKACPAVPRTAQMVARYEFPDGRVMYTPAGMTLGELRRVCASAETQVRDKEPQPASRLDQIAAILEAVDARCAASDGPVTPTLSEIRPAELRKIYRLAKGKK